MAFNYDGLKKITGAGIVDGQIATADIGTSQITNEKIGDGQIITADIPDSAITNAKIGDSQITTAKYASGAVDTTQGTVTGTLPISRGGTSRNTLGSANQALRVNDAGDGYTYDYVGPSACRVYTSNGTWTRPAGVTKIHVQVVGGGGGGTGHGEAGGAGGWSEEILDVTSISSVSITIGGGGGGVNYHNVAGNGATTSFGPYLSASGGEGARRVGGHSGGRPGVGSGGNINLYGGGGSGHTNHGGGEGGMSYWGGSSIGVHDSGPQVSNQESRAAPGTGGTGGPRALRRGGTGRGGMVIVWEYK